MTYQIKLVTIKIKERQSFFPILNPLYSSNEYMLANLTNRECDRFIPHRNHFKPQHPASPCGKQQTNCDSAYNYLIKRQLLSSQEIPSFISTQKSLSQFSEHYSEKEAGSKLKNNIESPVKILDVPQYKDDFYFNNIDWSSKGPLGIALQNEVFLYTPDNIIQVKKGTSSTVVTGIKTEDQLMSVGHSNGCIELYDIEKCALVRSLTKHENRVAALMFLDGLLVSGSKDKSIIAHDLRQRDHVINVLKHHKGEICTLKAKNQNERIFASGGADGSAIIWDLKFGFIDQLKGHKGAVKALDWCPWKSGILATGGGNHQDRSIKLWNTNNSSLIYKQTISSQISSLIWNEQINMLISAHGYDQNSLNFWSLESSKGGSCKLYCKKQFNAHFGRILNMVQSHQKSYLCTVGSDENLKFWQLFEKEGANPFQNIAKQQISACDSFRL